jgi:two-component system chemotaxis sensor kinase CheA
MNLDQCRIVEFCHYRYNNRDHPKHISSTRFIGKKATHLEAIQTKPVPIKKNRRTLRKRIYRSFMLSSVFNVLFFGLIIVLILAFAFKPVIILSTNFISGAIASDMNKAAFLQDQDISDLRAFDPTSNKASAWRKHLEELSKVEYYFPLLEMSGDHPIQNEGAEIPAELVYVTVIIDSKLVYTNMPQESTNIVMNGPIGSLYDLYAIDSIKPLLDEQGVEIGQVHVGIVPDVATFFLTLLFVLFCILIMISLFMNVVISKLFTLPVIAPLNLLESNFRALAEGDYATTIESQQLQTKRPLREIESITNSNNRILQTMKNYTEQLQKQKDTVDEQYEELEAQNDELVRSKEMIETAQRALENRERSLRNLLDNAGQGFLTFGKDLLIDEHYSEECTRMFDCEFGGIAIPALLSLGDVDQEKFLLNIFTRIFEEQDAYKRSIYVPLLPEEIEREGKIVHIAYKLIRDPNSENDQEAVMMVILTDITETRQLQHLMNEERNILNMVVHVVSHYNDYVECASDYRKFCMEELNERLQSNKTTTKNKWIELYRELHTYKGNFAQIGLIHIVRRLHEVENRISTMLRDTESMHESKLIEWVNELKLETWLDEDLDILKQYLGEAFFQQQDVLLVDKSRLLDIEKKMLAVLSPAEYRLLLPEIRRLRYKSFMELINSYPEYVSQLAERFEKGITPFQVEGQDFLADTSKYYDFSRSLTHLFRNVVDHGIEHIDERMARGKDEFGRVQFKLALDQGTIVIQVEDDGAGIDLDSVRHKAIERGLLTSDEASAMPSDEIMLLIFHPDFSTKSQVTDISGRGMGLSSVQAEVMKLGGTIQVTTNAGQGTSFRIELPYEEIHDFPELEFPAVLEPIVEKSRAYFQEFLQLDFKPLSTFELLPVDKLLLRKVTTFVNVRGALEGTFILSVDHPLSLSIVNRFLFEEVSDEEITLYIEDSLAESANIILGNSMRTFDNFEEYILMDPPITFFTENASVRYAQSDIWRCDMDCDEGGMSVCFIISNKS